VEGNTGMAAGACLKVHHRPRYRPFCLSGQSRLRGLAGAA
jgi:hypothetical protein